jgi:hypothetical protein
LGRTDKYQLWDQQETYAKQEYLREWEDRIKKIGQNYLEQYEQDVRRRNQEGMGFNADEI